MKNSHDIPALQGVEVVLLGKEGIYRDCYILCKCCEDRFTVSAFEAHCGSTFRRPYKSITDLHGKSLLDYKNEYLSTLSPWEKTSSPPSPTPVLSKKRTLTQDKQSKRKRVVKDSLQQRELRMDRSPSISPKITANRSTNSLSGIQTMRHVDAEDPNQDLREPKVVGDIVLYPFGSAFADRFALRATNMHTRLHSGVDGAPSVGATSIVLDSECFEDTFEEIILQLIVDHVTDTKTIGGKVKREPISNRSYQRTNELLSISREREMPIRIIRGSKLMGQYSPVSPARFRYDGLYRVARLDQFMEGPYDDVRWTLTRLPNQTSYSSMITKMKNPAERITTSNSFLCTECKEWDPHCDCSNNTPSIHSTDPEKGYSPYSMQLPGYEDCGVEYMPSFIQHDIATSILTQLLELEWERHNFGANGSVYEPKVNRMDTSDDSRQSISQTLRNLLQQSQRIQPELEHCIVQLFADGDNHLLHQNGHDQEKTPNSIRINLGGPKTFQACEKKSGQVLWEVQLRHGSLLRLNGNTQRLQYNVLSPDSKEGPQISLVFCKLLSHSSVYSQLQASLDLDTASPTQYPHGSPFHLDSGKDFHEGLMHSFVTKLDEFFSNQNGTTTEQQEQQP
eukprot:TRINITY_DN3714_c0_g1_i1.p1 TRINITY_DN3714_c0_g1~~TRINITY_DN3714_c0_g1_i1.p1  ORF type:complete len:632 (-),score=93.47 TRINITY_DN3714_c0_g1_i1:94-1956(-)